MSDRNPQSLERPMAAEEEMPADQPARDRTQQAEMPARAPIPKGAAAAKVPKRRGGDQLLYCLLRACRLLGKPITEADLRARVPVSPNGLTLAQLHRAASRLDLRTRYERRLDAALLRAMPTPFILLDRGGRIACLAEARAEAEFRIYEPGVEKTQTLALSEVLDRFGSALLIAEASQVAPTGSWRGLVARKLRGVLGELLIASLVINLLALATPIFVMTLFNKVIGQQALDTLSVLVVAMAAVYLFDAALRMLRGYVSSHTGARIDALIASEVMHHFVNLPYRVFESTPSGQLAERLRQLDVVRSFFTGQMPLVIVDLGFIVVFLLALFLIHPTVAMITAGVMPLFVGISLVSHRKQMQLVEQRFSTAAAKTSSMTETLINAVTVKSLGLEAEMERRWEARLAAAAYTGFRSHNLTNLVQSIGHLLRMVVSLAILYIGALLVMRGQMTIGALIAANILSGRTIQPLSSLVSAWHQLQEVRMAFRRLDDIMEQPSELVTTSATASAQIAGDIQIDGVSFGYDQERAPVLKNVDLTIERGSIMGIVGPSGSGKTTLAKLLQGLHAPSSGRILIDHNDLAHLTPASVRRSIGVVPQETQLFSGSVRDNIAIGSNERDPDRITAVAKFVGAHDFIQRLPQGYDTQLGERGVGLSAGQRQLLCIARALIRNPRVLIFDEATSDLDPVTEELLMRNLQRAARGRTIIIVTHRMAPLTIADRVALLVDGQVERVGPPGEVVAFARTRLGDAKRQAQV